MSQPSKNLVIVPYCLETGRFFGEERRDRCFVSMTFSSQFQEIYDHAVKPSIEEAGFRCVRFEPTGSTRIIAEAVTEGIRNSRCVVADVTDTTSTVLYEIGVAHALKKPVILLSQHRDYPFDVRGQVYIVYERTFGGVEPLRRSLRDALQALRLADS